MKYILCGLAVIAEFFAYSMIGAMLGWRHGGGVLPMMLLWAVWAATCRAIIKHFNAKDEDVTTAANVETDEELTDEED